MSDTNRMQINNFVQVATPPKVLRAGWVALCVTAAMLLVGCANSNQSGSPTTTPSPAEPTAVPGSTTASASMTTSAAAVKHAECLVCKKNADLACIDVDVDPATPTYLFNGKTYYFCSNECRNKFVKNPQKYLDGK